MPLLGGSETLLGWFCTALLMQLPVCCSSLDGEDCNAVAFTQAIEHSSDHLVCVLCVHLVLRLQLFATPLRV